MATTALVPITDGIEEIEAVCVIDVLRRAGVDVTVARVPSPTSSDPTVRASRGVWLRAEVPLNECLDHEWDAIVLPGGLPGAEYLRDDPELTALLERQDEAGRWLAAICASPAVVLQRHGLIRGRAATCFPGLRDQLPTAVRSDDRVVIDGNLVTSQGPGTALEFSLAVVACLAGPERRAEIASQLLTD